MAYTPQQAEAYFNANPDVAAAYKTNTYGLSPEDFAAAHYQQYGSMEQRAAPDVAAASPLYTTLTAQSTPDQIAAAYNQFVSTGGGDTAFNQQAATNYLTNLGVAAPAVQTAYNQYMGDYASGVADKLATAFTGGNDAATNAYFNANPDVAKAYANRTTDPNLASTVNMTPAEFAATHYNLYGSKPEEGRYSPTTAGILSGFEALGRGDFTEDQAKRLLGEDKFNDYKGAFASEADKYLTGILADNKVSGQEAIDFMQNARKYGIDTPEEFADLTGKNKDLYTALSSGYDNTVKSLVNSSLGAATTDGDRLKTGLALQDKFGLTYDDLAKATGYDTKQIKDWFEPVRNFSTDYKTITSKPDVTGKDILDFLDKSNDNGSVAAAFGSSIDTTKQALTALEDKWKPYGVDGYQAENIYKQLNTITNAVGGKNWAGDWKGGGDNAAKEAASTLAKKGVDNLTDLKVVPNYEKTTANGETYQGQLVRTDENGGKYIVEQSWDGAGGSIVPLPAGAQTTPVKINYDMEGGLTGFQPLSEAELKTYDPKTGTYEAAAGNKLIDASSGKVVAKGDGNNFVLDSYESGNFFKNKDHTLGLMMTDKGVPVPYQTTQKGGFLYSPIMPIMASLLLPGVGTALSGGIASATSGGLAAGTLANQALTQGIMSGALSQVAGGDFGKGFVGGAVNPLISAGVSSMLPTGMDPAMARTATNVGSGVVSSALTGRPIDWGSTLLNAGVQYGAQQLPWNLTPQQVNLLGGIATPLLQGQSIDPIRLGGVLANYAIKNQAQTGAR